MTLQMQSQSPQSLRETIERSVQSRTGGLIRQLRVDVFGGEVVLSGRTSTYYNKQLATHAALDEIDDLALTNEIEVC
jgi:hypothetical protein